MAKEALRAAQEARQERALQKQPESGLPVPQEDTTFPIDNENPPAPAASQAPAASEAPANLN